MEKYYVFAFSARTESMRFFEILKRRGVQSAIINTPRIITLGCGLSVKVYSRSYRAAVSAFGDGSYRTFLGAYEITVIGGRSSARRVFN